MSFKLRPITFAYYRLFFVVILFLMALLCLSQAAMEYFYGVSFIPATPTTMHDAMLAGAIITGILSLIYSAFTLNIVMDKRTQNSDRRQRQVAIDFPDRRSDIDRRTGLSS